MSDSATPNERVPADHLREDEAGRLRCDECGCQISVGSSGVEYGHAKNSSRNRRGGARCPHRPTAVDPSGARSENLAPPVRQTEGSP